MDLSKLHAITINYSNTFVAYTHSSRSQSLCFFWSRKKKPVALGTRMANTLKE